MNETDRYHFERIVAAAVAGQRAPTNNEVPRPAKARLEQIGAIKRHMVPNNVTVVEILTGPHAGKRTAAMTRRVE